MDKKGKTLKLLGKHLIGFQVVERLLILKIMAVKKVSHFYGKRQFFAKFTLQRLLLCLPIAVLPPREFPKPSDRAFFLTLCNEIAPILYQDTCCGDTLLHVLTSLTPKPVEVQ